jgi:hypothetical protein
MKWYAFHLMFAGLLFTACSKSKQADHDPLLEGKWKWIQKTDAEAINGIPYDTLTPQSTGLESFLNLNQDGSWSFTKNGIPVSGGYYKMLTVTTPEGPIDFLDLADQHGKDSTLNHSISNDTLYTSSALYNGRYTVDIYTKE